MHMFFEAIVVHIGATAVVTLILLTFRGPIVDVTSNLANAFLLVRRIAGDWEVMVEPPDCPSYRQRVQLSQFGTYVWGIIECENANCRFRFSGRLTHHNLTARFGRMQNAEFAVDNGTFSLFLSDEGDRMSGWFTDRGGSLECSWRKTSLHVGPDTSAGHS